MDAYQKQHWHGIAVTAIMGLIMLVIAFVIGRPMAYIMPGIFALTIIIMIVFAKPLIALQKAKDRATKARLDELNQ